MTTTTGPAISDGIALSVLDNWFMTLPVCYSPDFFQLAMRRVLPHCWAFVGDLDQLQEPGDYLTETVGNVFMDNAFCDYHVPFVHRRPMPLAIDRTRARVAAQSHTMPDLDDFRYGRVSSERLQREDYDVVEKVPAGPAVAALRRRSPPLPRVPPPADGDAGGGAAQGGLRATRWRRPDGDRGAATSAIAASTTPRHGGR